MTAYSTACYHAKAAARLLLTHGRKNPALSRPADLGGLALYSCPATGLEIVLTAAGAVDRPATKARREAKAAAAQTAADMAGRAMLKKERAAAYKAHCAKVDSAFFEADSARQAPSPRKAAKIKAKAAARAAAREEGQAMEEAADKAKGAARAVFLLKAAAAYGRAGGYHYPARALACRKASRLAYGAFALPAAIPAPPPIFPLSPDQTAAILAYGRGAF